MSSSESEFSEVVEEQVIASYDVVDEILIIDTEHQEFSSYTNPWQELQGIVYTDDHDITNSSESSHSSNQDFTPTEESEEKSDEQISSIDDEKVDSNSGLGLNLLRLGVKILSSTSDRNKLKSNYLDFKGALESKLPPETIEEVQEDSESSGAESLEHEKGNPKLFHILLKKIFEDELERMGLERSAQKMYKLRAKSVAKVNPDENLLHARHGSKVPKDLVEPTPKSLNSSLAQIPGNLEASSAPLVNLESPKTPQTPHSQEYPESPKDRQSESSQGDDQMSESSLNHISLSVNIPVAQHPSESPLSKSPKAASVFEPILTETTSADAPRIFQFRDSMRRSTSGDMLILQEEKKKLIEQLSDQNIKNHELQVELEYMKSQLDEEHQDRMRKEVNTYLTELETILREKKSLESDLKHTSERLLDSNSIIQNLMRAKNQWLRDKEEIKIYENKVQDIKEELETHDPENKNSYDKRIRTLQQENNTLKKSLHDISKSKEAIALKIKKETSAKELLFKEKEDSSIRLKNLITQLENQKQEKKHLKSKLEQAGKEMIQAEEEKKQAEEMCSKLKNKLQRVIEREEFQTPQNLKGSVKKDIVTLRKCLDFKLEKMYKIV